MDMIRVAYTTRMRLWADSDDLVEVRWFRAKDGARPFDGPSLLRSNFTWGKFYSKDPKMGEIDREDFGYDKGANPLMYDGRHRCGREQALRTGGVHGVDPPLDTDDNGNLPCCQTPPVTQVCIPFDAAPNQLLLPDTMRLRVIDRGLCFLFGDVDVPIVRAGYTPYNDPTDPGAGNFCTGGSCWAMWATDDVTRPGEIGAEYILRVAVGFWARGSDAPPGCNGAECNEPFFYCKMVRRDTVTGARSILLQSCATMADIESFSPAPLRLEWVRDQSIGVPGYCLLGGGAGPSSATLFRLTVD